MSVKNSFSIQIVPKALIAGRYRWHILEDGQVRAISPRSYTTRREAKLAAEEALREMITKPPTSEG